MRRAGPRFGMVLLLSCLSAFAIGHDFIVVSAGVVVDADTVSVTVLFDQSDLLAGLGERRLSFVDLAEVAAMNDRIAVYLEHGAHLRFDGAEVPLRLAACLEVATSANRSSMPPRQLTFLLRAQAPLTAHRLAFSLDVAGEAGTAVITTAHIQARGRSVVRTVGRAEAVELEYEDPPPFGPSDAAHGADSAAAPGTEAPGWRDWLRAGFRRIIQRGFWRTMFIDHAAPVGLDHILFVLGLFLLSPRLRTVLTQITAFTVAHSLTLGLSLLGVWSAPSSVIEPIIAASIAAVAIENIVVRELNPWRWPIVFVFGLVHGLGFGSTLAKAVPPGHVWGPLFAMNLGLECAQLTVVAIAAALTLPWTRRSWYRRGIVVPASAVIALTGCWWTVERLLAVAHARS